MVLVGTPNGVVKVNCIKRLPMNQAKDPELLKSIRGYPWRLTPGDVQNEPGEVPPWSPASRSCRRMSCHRVCRESGRQKLHPGGCTSGETLSCGSTASRRAAEAAWLPRLATRPRTTRRRADGASNLPWRQMMLNERGSRRIDERVRRLEPRAGGFEDLPVGEMTTDDNDADVGGAADDTAPLTQGAGSTALGVGGSSSSSTRPEARGAGSTAPGDEPEVKRRREALSTAIQGITDELRAFGAVVGPKFMHCATQEAKGFEINQLDLKDAVVNEFFCKNGFSSRALSFGVHPGFAIDYTTGWDFDEPDRETEAFQLRETVRPKLLVGSSECKAWSQLQNLSKGQAAV